MVALTKKAQGAALVVTLVIGAGLGVAGGHFLPKEAHEAKVAQPTQGIQEVIVVTPTSSPSATPTMVVEPTKALYRVGYPTKAVGR